MTDPSQSVPETRVSVARPSWLAAWTAGDWRREVEARPEERAKHFRWFLEQSADVRALMLRYPAGTVVGLREGAICAPLGPFEASDPLASLAPFWAQDVGFVTSYLAPSWETIPVAREGGLFLRASPEPRSPECWVRVEDVGEVLGYLRGYGPDQARENLRELVELLGEAFPPEAP